jgi:adenine-specific DNA-methyltransferase
MAGKFGDIVREARTHMGLGIRRFAAEMRVDRSYVSAVETGKKPPSDEFIARAAGLLGLELESLRTAAGRYPRDVEKILAERPDEVVAVIRERFSEYEAPAVGQLELFEPPLAPSPGKAAQPTVQIIKYMGSKREIIDFVVDGIRSVLPDDGTLLDVFAGTHSIGFALRGSHRVFATDIQEYSTAIGRALLRSSRALPAVEAFWKELEPYVEANRAQLQERLSDLLDEERHLLLELPTSATPERYAEFQASWPHAGDLPESGGHPAALFRRWLSQCHSNHKAEPYCLFTTYFACGYFSLAQATWIDSIRLALDKALSRRDHLYWIGLAALMHACSYCTPGPGHFAEFRELNGSVGSRDIMRYRARSVKSYFRDKYAELRRLLTAPTRRNRVWTDDFRRVLDSDVIREVNAVYADPPYSFVHYSRFYHVLETLVRYDYPDCRYYGRYRDDRHQSDFCIRTKVANAFDDLARPTAEAKLPLVISYSDTGMITLDDVVGICEQRYRPIGGSVEMRSLDYLHCTMGRRGDKTRDVTEHLVVCRPA